jgi:hypothetical protein
MELRKLTKIVKENPEYQIEGIDVLAFDCYDIFQLTISELADLDRHLENNDYQEFCDIFVKGNPTSIHLYKIIEEFGRQKAKLKENYRYIFDPPIYGEIQQETIGSELRKEFVEEFGTYVVLTDLICKGDITKFKEVEKWTVEQFFFWANYLSGQRILENVK